MEEQFHLRLKFPPTPTHAPQLADSIAEAARDISGVNLDYSRDSLPLVQQVLDGMRADELPLSAIAETLFCFGCYVGEVIRRNTGATWVAATGTPLEQYCSWPLIIAFAPDDVCNPIGKVFKYYEFGSGEDLSYFYRVFASKHEQPDA